jgi:hypothetical protein
MHPPVRFRNEKGLRSCDRTTQIKTDQRQSISSFFWDSKRRNKKGWCQGSSNRRVRVVGGEIENDLDTSGDFMDRRGRVLRRVTLPDAVTQPATPGAYLKLSRYLK